MKKSYILSASVIIMSLAASAAFAQSTATEAVETVIVKGTRTAGDLFKESGAKTKVVIGQDLISKASAGQSIADILNTVPGYNFTNNDAYGSSGGNMRIRGMDGSRISLTVDGVQLNDSGNYAIYTNQQLEPELICRASVATGATDVDSMTASATGGTVNYNTCRPEDNFGGVVKLSGGDWGFHNAFLRLDTGKIGPFGTKAFFAVTDQKYDTWTRDAQAPATLEKKQYNIRLFQDLANDGYLSLAAHFNENRNRLMFNQSYASLMGTPTATSGYDYNSAGVERVNPSDTGNIRIQSKFNFGDKFTLTIDPTFQYVMANGGGGFDLRENDAVLCGSFYGTTGCGTDLNKDGDKSDTIRVFSPSNTNTYRYSLNTSGIYRIDDAQTLRVGLSFDRARHRQTGERSLFGSDGITPQDVFSAKFEDEIGVYTQDDDIMQSRNRLSLANVDVASLEYRGNFLEDKLSLSLGVRYQKMERELNQYCYSLMNGSQTVLCTTEAPNSTTATADSDISVVTFASKGTSKYFTPYNRTYEVSKTLPNIGATWRFNDQHQVYASYGESLSSPRTDSYYNVALGADNRMIAAEPSAETSTNIEVGYRFVTPKVYATAALFSAKDANRILSAYDEELNNYVDRNVGDVERNGFEGLVTYSPLKSFNVSASYSYTSAEMQSDLDAAAGVIPTKGKQLAETPEHMATFAVNYDFAEQLHFNLFGKYVGERFTTDVNDASVPDYVVWNGSMRYDLNMLRSGTYIQATVVNLFDTKYAGSIGSTNNAITIRNGSTTISSGRAPGVNAGVPRTFSVSLRAKF